MSMNSRSLLLSPNPNSLKYRFTNGLLSALSRINRKQSQQPRSAREIRKRHRLIKAAAYGSMASSVGNRRAWSRALLWKIRNQTRRGYAARRNITSSSRQLSMKKRICDLQKGDQSKNRVEVGGMGQVDKLRRLVPGGQIMDTCSLLEETAHYMKCLVTQVKVMTSIVEIYSLP
ncbi:transcription factor IBH1-like [Argentina anserina]|uniref:transcription factor IBH1-like n=1 Tax=Argentina anserina TaxID=57926 RepID=UPI0021762179|nr:transcription factor IBH1-like [Potentilla anserina]